MPKTFKKQPEPPAFDDDESDETLDDLMRSDFVFEARDRCTLGKPRCIALKEWDDTFVRIAPPVDRAEHASRRSAASWRSKCS